MALTKIGSIGVSTGIQFAGVTTIATLNASDNVLSVGGTVNFVSDVSIGGTVSIAGTLTYEDVTNIDSVGLITARNGIEVGSGVTLTKDGDATFTGITTSTTFVSASSLITGNLTLGDKIIHDGDSNTAIRFPAADTFTVETAGSERLRIDSTGATKIVTGIVTTLTVTTGIVTTLTSNTTRLNSTTTAVADINVSGANITLEDSGSATDDRILLGAGGDLQLFHDGTNSVISNLTGDLYIENDSSSTTEKIYIRPKATESSITCHANGAVELYHDNLQRLTTQAAGVDVQNETECFFKITRTNNSPSDSDYVGNLIFVGKDSANNVTEYGKIVTQIVDQTDGTEDGRMILQSMKDGTMTTAATVEHGIFQRNTAPGYFGDNAQWTSSNPNMHLPSLKWNSGHYVSATGVFTCPVAGKYLCTATVQAHRANNNTGGSSTYYNVLWQKNNSNYHIEMVGTVAANAGALGVSDVNGKHEQVTATAIIDCAKDDTIRAHSNHGYRNASQNIVGVILIA